MLTMQQVYSWINERAPFDTQVPYDNSGLLVGHPDREVTGIQIALDVTPAVIDAAIRNSANLIITHHPMMFSARKQLVETDFEGGMLCRMIRSGIGLISAHTNLDQAPGGVNDVLAAAIGLVNVQGEGFIRVGELLSPMKADELAQHVQRCLGDVVRVYGPRDVIVAKVGMCSGSGSDEWPAAAAMGAEAFLTGEVKHHIGLAAEAAGVVMLEAGHHATEVPGIFALGNALQSWLDDVQCNVRVFR